MFQIFTHAESVGLQVEKYRLVAEKLKNRLSNMGKILNTDEIVLKNTL